MLKKYNEKCMQMDLYWIEYIVIVIGFFNLDKFIGLQISGGNNVLELSYKLKYACWAKSYHSYVYQHVI